MTLTTLTRAKSALLIDESDESRDDALSMQIDAASDFFEGETGRKYGVAAYNDTFRANGEVVLFLRQYPVLSDPVVTVTVDGVANTDWTLEAASGLIAKESGWKGTVIVSYSAGYVLPGNATKVKPATLPKDIETAVIQLAGIAVNMAGSEHLSEETLGPLRYKYVGQTPLFIQRIIDRYRKPAAT